MTSNQHSSLARAQEIAHEGYSLPEDNDIVELAKSYLVLAEQLKEESALKWSARKRVQDLEEQFESFLDAAWKFEHEMSDGEFVHFGEFRRALVAASGEDRASNQHSEPPVMATDFAIVVSGLGLVGDGYDDERGAALHRIRDRMASLEEQLEAAHAARDEALRMTDGMARAPYGEFAQAVEERDRLRAAIKRELGYTHGADTIDRLRAALNPAMRPDPPTVLPDPDIDLSTGQALTGKRRGPREQST